MNDIILSRGARVPPARMVVVLSAEGRQIRRRLAKNLVRSAQLTVLALKLLEPATFLVAQPCTAPAVARHSRGSGNRPDVPTCAASPPYTRASTPPRGSPTTANHVHPGAPAPGALPAPGLSGSILSVKSSAFSSQRLNEWSLRVSRGGSGSTPACTTSPGSTCCSRSSRPTTSCSPRRWWARCIESARPPICPVPVTVTPASPHHLSGERETFRPRNRTQPGRCIRFNNPRCGSYPITASTNTTARVAATTPNAGRLGCP